MKITRLFSVVWLVAILTAACRSTPQPTPTPTADKVVLNLQWITQAQFAGYYVALDKGWYAEEGINLTINPGGPDISSLDSVISGRAQFGTVLLADIIVAIQAGKPLVSISQIQQSNGLLLLAHKDSGIASPQDFKGKRVGVWLGNWEAQFDALMAKEGLQPSDYTLVAQGFSMDSFINGELDVASAMVYNEYHVVLESGIKAEDVNIINYADYGLDFPGDVLFTSRSLTEKDPDLCIRMVRASLRGWQYAIEHPEEAADIVLKYDKSGIQTREHQIAMMNEVTKLVQLTLRPLGYTDRTDIRRAIDTLHSYNIISSSIDPEEVFTNEFWEDATKK